MTNRRDFLKTIGVASAGAMLAQSDLFAKQLMAKPKQIGLQLYTLREELAKDALAHIVASSNLYKKRVYKID